MHIDMRAVNECKSICLLAHLILYLDCRSLFLELLDFPGHMSSKELSLRISESVDVIGSFLVFRIMFVGNLEIGLSASPRKPRCLGPDAGQ